MEETIRPEIPEEKIFEVKNNTKKIDFSRPYRFIYFDWWFHLLTMPFFLLCYTAAFLATFYFGFRVRNRKNLRILKKRGCITVSNHCHYFDTVFANFVVFPRRLYVTVVQRNYEVPIVRRILRFLKAFPIPGGPVGFKMITEPIGEALRRGYHVHFLPEGELVHLSQTIHRFRPGAFFQSYLHQAPVLPMVYVMKRRKLFGKELPPNWVKMEMVVGEPIYPPPLSPEGSFPREALKEMSEKAASWMEKTISDFQGTEN
ncbi:lysophospholipid acyltransferase family protein [Spirochaeta isovalerica]|uniref:1-acyl-sn-glycerol-3-phosphate acyltransferase n=1 Tax=Spirochaeta isovalerica TaxID=150 RepID=A0A841R7D7_9SPIO|nr:lysophospholipid acyltransferase family protein [Spirochaeta isovalerica]MBB6478889.1 1-acyl-sn-glycerol-3-phosphate acyltransferase [Spirochaeta isovalerica]